ncbi:ATP-binding protein [Ancylobacter dichloromethanicus]|uniref:ATP-binding protein n=1 Tax=Ancylobacter dichloromethanicus TaxID=518825 RepID=A0A9W6J7A2_9HYPH|nr:ATP-binding protein [Ancylobacter dichloromethanicus]MBS7554023.1 ATP-binding protein [Ancylobacter dichloromethanicus]GLK71136.1 ATP-binding protein [Ancylobacter dichloromethanicus]
MKIGIELGSSNAGQPVRLDLEELLSTRLLVQGNSGSGKSHLLRRLLEQSAGHVQQAIIDPEGDFVGLAERFGHVVIDAERTAGEIQRIAARIRRHRASVVFNLEGLDADAQMRSAAAFLNGLFEADREYWFPMLVVVDEAQLFAPAGGGEISDEARRISLSAMTNLMCRGRKRGLAGVIATQRLAKLAKNVAAEASNFLMGRTFLDIDMARAADLLGMEKRQAESFRDLNTGSFVALGPALSRRPLAVKIGDVETASRNGRPSLMPPPELGMAQIQDLIFDDLGTEPLPAPPPRRAPPATEVILETLEDAPAPVPGPVDPEVAAAFEAEREALVEEIVRQFVSDPEAPFRSAAALYPDFLVHCRVRRVGSKVPDLAEFTRRLAIARAGLDSRAGDESWGRAVEQAAGLPEEMQGVFLLLARAGMDGAPSPADEALARAYGSRSPSRGRWLLTYMEERGHLVCEADFRGRRVVRFPALGWKTAPGDPKALTA